MSSVSAFLAERNAALEDDDENSDDEGVNESKEEEEDLRVWDVSCVMGIEGEHPKQRFLVRWGGVDPATGKNWKDSWHGIDCFFHKAEDRALYRSDPTYLPPAVVAYKKTLLRRSKRKHTSSSSPPPTTPTQSSSPPPPPPLSDDPLLEAITAFFEEMEKGLDRMLQTLHAHKNKKSCHTRSKTRAGWDE